MSNVTRSDIAATRRTVEQATTEVRRWGMVLSAVSSTRRGLERGVVEGPSDAAVRRFERLLTGGESTPTADRPGELAYLANETIPEGPGSGKTVLAYAGNRSGLGSFPGTLRSYVAAGTDAPSPADVLAAFEQDALVPAVERYDPSAENTRLDALVDVLEAGQRAARAHRDAAIDRLNNTFQDGDRTADGLVQRYHQSADAGEGGATHATHLAAAAPTQNQAALQDYHALLAGMDERPAVLLPVGLETRFLGAGDDRTGGSDELWVRVYPDDIHVDVHESPLTPREERWGRTFWTRVYLARFPIAYGSDGGGPPRQRFYVDPKTKLPDDPDVVDELRHLFYDTDEGTTIADYSRDGAERYREIKERAWGHLVERAGQERAAYVAHRTAPVDVSDDGDPETATAVLSGPIAPDTTNAADRRQAVRNADDLSFPDVEHRPGSWTRQPRARFLPDRWLLTVEWTDDDGTERSGAVVADNVVREPLYMGPNPEAVAVSKHDADTEAARTTRAESATDAVDDGMEWMVDFEEAERAGMALRVTPDDLGTADLPDRFDRVVVTGLKATMGADDGADALADLLDVHHYTRGLELLPEGTPTNNHDGESGYRRDRDHLATVDTEVGAPLTTPGEPTDGNLLANVLGLGQADGEAHPFAHVAGADDTDWLDAYHMHSVLWPGTLGHYLRHVLAPGKYLDSSTRDVWSDWITETALLGDVREHFLRFVRGGGPLPALRVGSQPYGVLPATPVDRHRQPSGSETEDSVYWFLLRAVTVIRRFWEQSLGNVPRVDPEKAADASADGPLGGALDDPYAVRLGVTTGYGSGNEEEDAESSTAADVLDAVLQQDAVSNTFKHRHYYLEDLTPGYQHAGLGDSPYDALRKVGIDFDPRVTRFNFMEVLPNRDRFPYFDMVAGRKSVEPIPDAVAATDGYLDRLSRVTTADLVRLGYDLKLNRFPYLYRDAYTAVGSAENWDALSGLFHGERDALESWAGGDGKSSQVTRLDGLFETENEDLFVGHTSYVGSGDVEMPPEEPTTKTAVRTVLGSAHDDAEKNHATLNLLCIDALDDWLGEGDSLHEVTLTTGPDSGQVVDVHTALQDGHERLPYTLEDLQISVIDDLRERARNVDPEWPDGRGSLEELFHALTSACREHLDLGDFGYEGGDIPFQSGIGLLEDQAEVAAHGGLYTVNGGAFDNREMGNLSTMHSILASQLAAMNIDVFNAAWNVMDGLLHDHVVDYLQLAFALKGETAGDDWRGVYGMETDTTTAYSDASTDTGVTEGVGYTDDQAGSDEFVFDETATTGTDTVDLSAGTTGGGGAVDKSAWETWREDGASAVPTGDHAPLDLKVDRDTSLFNIVVWYAAINARMNVIEREDRNDLLPIEVLVGNRGNDRADTAYELLDRESGGTFDRFTRFMDESAVEERFGAHRWFGMLDAMGSDVGLGNDVTDDRFAAFQGSLRWMANDGWLDGDTDDVEALFASSLDLASHRLDAWWTSLGTRRLAEIRSADGAGGPDGGFDVDVANAWVNVGSYEEPNYAMPKVASKAWSLPEPEGDRGSYVGAYGVVENLERDYDEAEREYEYIQSPSVHHATTAAILRSGYRSHPSGDFRETMKIDLSPGRVRNARWILRGLRQGLWLGEMLGYHFERRLHQVSRARTDVDLEQYIAEFREFKPFAEGKIHESRNDGDPSLQADPIDGYALYQTAVDRGLGHVFREVMPKSTEKEREAARDVLEELERLVDSVGDLVTAENVHQLQQGNYSQAGRSLSALSEGKPPRDPDVVRTTRDQVGVTHRLLVLSGLGVDPGEADLAAPDVWQVTDTVTTPVLVDGDVKTGGDRTPVTTDPSFAIRDDAAPVLNELAGRLFPDPGTVSCVATYRWTTATGDDGETEHSVDTAVTLADLRLTPVDALWLTQRTGEAGASKLESHVAYHVLRDRPDHSPPVPNDATVDIAFGETPDAAPAGDVSFSDFVELSRSLRDLVGEGRPADGSDLAHPGDEATGDRVQPPLGSAADARDALENVRDVLANRLDLLASVEAPAADFREESGQSGDQGGGAQPDGGQADDGQPGGDQSGSAGDAARSDGLAADADALQTRLAAFGEATHLSSLDDQVDAFSGSTLLDELERVESRLAVGPTTPDAVDADVVVEPGTATVGGAVPDGERVDVYLPADDLRIEGRVPAGGEVGELVVTDGTGDPIAELELQVDGNDVVAEFPAEEVLDGRFPIRRIGIRLVESDAELTAIRGDDAPGGGTYGTRVQAVVAHPDLLAPLRNDDLTVTLRVESASPTVRFSRSAPGVAVGADGRYGTEMDLGGLTPGAAFDVVAVAELEGSASPVVDARTGHVVGEAPEPGIDDEFVGSQTVLPRLLWLAANADAFAVDTEFGPRDVADLATVGEIGTTTPGPDLAADSGDDSLTPAERLGKAIASADWPTLDREAGLMPSANTTYDASDRAAVEHMLDLESVDVAAIAETLTSTTDPRGVVTVARRLGLTDAITVVGTDAPYAPDEQTFYGADEAAQGEARARIRAFRRNPWPSATRWRYGSLLAVDGDLVTFLEDEGAETALERALRLVGDDAWTVERLAHLTDDPADLVRNVNDLLYHPDELGAGDYADVADDLQALATDVSAGRNDRDVVRHAEAFDAVRDVETDFVDPFEALARALRSYSPGGHADVSPQAGETKFETSFDDAVGSLSTRLDPLVTAYEGDDMGEAFREGLLETVRRQMLRAAYFGVYGATPSVGGGTPTDERNLARTVTTVVEKIDERLAADDDVDADDPVDEEVDRRTALFGDDFEVLPPFEPLNVRELGRTFGSQEALLDHDAAGPLPIRTWLQRSARVRERPRMLRETLTYADTVDAADHLALDVGQFPHYPDDDWVGLDGVRPSVNDRVSVVAYTDDGFEQSLSANAGGPTPQFAGLFLDEWEEQVPAEEETTGVSFRYDDPGNQPPQSILLAAPPKREDGPAWSLADLLGTIEETLDVAKYRGVDLEALSPESDPDRTAADTLFPGLFFAHDTHLQPNHPTVDFTPLEVHGQYIQQLDLLGAVGDWRDSTDLLNAARFGDMSDIQSGGDD